MQVRSLNHILQTSLELSLYTEHRSTSFFWNLRISN